MFLSRSSPIYRGLATKVHWFNIYGHISSDKHQLAQLTIDITIGVIYVMHVICITQFSSEHMHALPQILDFIHTW